MKSRRGAGPEASGGGSGGSWLAPYREAWAANLDKLAAHLDEMDDG